MASWCQRSFTRLRNVHSSRHLSNASTSSCDFLLTLEDHDAATLAQQLRSKGFAKTSHPLLTPQACRRVKERIPKLFRGEFETGIYPDEWHWREGISLPNAAREICNAWKSDRTIASIVLNERLGHLIAQITGWESVRIAQDDLVWKPPSTSDVVGDSGRIDTVGFHQDSAYISHQFEPYENNSVTLWMALDDADEETGCVEYAAGSHRWRPILHRREDGGNTERDATLSSTDTAQTSEIASFHSSDETSYRDGLLEAARLADIYNAIDTIEPAPAKEGFAILHDQNSWHGSGPNQSCIRHRRALVGHYLRGDVSFREVGENLSNTMKGGPFGCANYIYGRYKRYSSVELDESFFPIIYGENRTVWLDAFLNA